MRYQLAGRHIASECYAAKGPALKRVCGPFFPGSRRGMPSARLSPLRPDPSEHALETWVFVKPLASPAVCTSKVTDDMFIRYTRKLLHWLHSLATCAPVDPCYFYSPARALQVRSGTPQWLGRYSHRGVFDQWHAMRLRVGYLVSRLAVSAGAFEPTEWQLRRVGKSCGLGIGGLKRP